MPKKMIKMAPKPKAPTPPAIPKVKVPRADALAVANEIIGYLDFFLEVRAIAGSIRRRKAMVSDVEIVYIPKVFKVKRPGEMFSATYNSFLEAMKVLLEEGYFKKRLSVTGRTGYGVKSQKVWHVDSGIAIDFFRADAFNWWSVFTAKTGGKDSNVQISARAKRMGYKWASEKGGFTKRDTGELVIWVDSEEEIFKFVGLPYLPPHKRP